MACLSPSPSGRRLSELLEEKQEPFCLDMHLLEKGCSSARLLDGYDTAAMCWPTAGNDAAASVLRRLTSKKKKAAAAAASGGRGKKKQPPPPAGSGLLRLLLSKILHGKAAGRKKPAALQFSDSFKTVKTVVSSPSPCSKKYLDAVKTDAVAAGEEEETVYLYSDDSDSDDGEKQLSPVSVLEHPFDSAPTHGQSKCSGAQTSPKNPMAIVRELLEAAYSPALLTQLLAKSEDLIKDAAVWPSDLDVHDGDAFYYSYRTSPKNVHHDDDTPSAATTTTTSATAAAAAFWDTHRAELSRVSELVTSELPSSRLDAADVEPERRDIAAGLEAAVLDALLQELVLDL